MRLREVLKRLQEFGFRLRREKCAFLPSIEYLGNVITADGLKPCGNKVRAIVAAPSPKDASQLRSFLGLMNYYGKFLPNLSSILSPLYELLHKQKSWVWKGEQAHAFKRAKELLTSESLLLHFDPEKDIIVSCDASPYGIGAVLSHRVDGVERPVCFISRSLSVAEKGYSQLDREALAIIFAIKKFHQYLYGRMFTIHTDHKPLQHILGEMQTCPAIGFSEAAEMGIDTWSL